MIRILWIGLLFVLALPFTGIVLVLAWMVDFELASSLSGAWGDAWGDAIHRERMRQFPAAGGAK